MTLYVYSMWVYQAEAAQAKHVKGCVANHLHSRYTLASGYVRCVTMTERIPNNDGFTMPLPRSGPARNTGDMELNAMVM